MLRRPPSFTSSQELGITDRGAAGAVLLIERIANMLSILR